MPSFSTYARLDGSCLIVMSRLTRDGPVIDAVAWCGPRLFPTKTQIAECKRALLGEPVHVDVAV